MSASASPPRDPVPAVTWMRREIVETPAVVEGLLRDGVPEIEAAAAAIRRYRPRVIKVVGRGTSDNAGIYARYLMELTLGIPVALAAASITTVYGAHPEPAGQPPPRLVAVGREPGRRRSDPDCPRGQSVGDRDPASGPLAASRGWSGARSSRARPRGAHPVAASWCWTFACQSSSRRSSTSSRVSSRAGRAPARVTPAR